MPRFKFDDLTGRVFSRLTVLYRLPNKGNSTNWKCRCECGNEVEVLGSGMRGGKTESCGCLHRERTSEARTTHGFSMNSKKNGWGCWRLMITRCFKEGSTGYDKYGGVGITVNPEWVDKQTGFQAFIEHIGERPSEKHTIDRFPNRKGNYEPGNVRWATRLEQGYNKDFDQTNTKSKYRGVTKASGFETRKKGWIARLKYNDKTYNLGYFYTEEEAAIAYNVKVLEVWGSDAILNIIEGVENENQ